MISVEDDECSGSLSLSETNDFETPTNMYQNILSWNTKQSHFESSLLLKWCSVMIKKSAGAY